MSTNPCQTHAKPVIYPCQPVIGKPRVSFKKKTWVSPTRAKPVLNPWFTRANPWKNHGFGNSPTDQKFVRNHVVLSAFGRQRFFRYIPIQRSPSCSRCCISRRHNWKNPSFLSSKTLRFCWKPCPNAPWCWNISPTFTLKITQILCHIQCKWVQFQGNWI